jgi:hypothetical protein
MGAKCFPIQSKNRWPAREPHAAASGRKNRVRPSRKIQSLRVPPGKIIKAQGMLLEGHSQREIGRTLHMSGHTVAKVIKAEDFVRHIKEMQERLFAIAPIAIESFRSEVATDGILAYTFLKDLGIIPSPEAIAQFLNATTPQTETGEERQARMLAAVLLEGRKNYGINLPEDFDAAMGKESQESQGAKTSQPKLLRK